MCSCGSAVRTAHVEINRNKKTRVTADLRAERRARVHRNRHVAAGMLSAQSGFLHPQRRSPFLCLVYVKFTSRHVGITVTQTQLVEIQLVESFQLKKP